MCVLLALIPLSSTQCAPCRPTARHGTRAVEDSCEREVGHLHPSLRPPVPPSGYALCSGGERGQSSPGHSLHFFTVQRPVSPGIHVAYCYSCYKNLSCIKYDFAIYTVFICRWCVVTQCLKLTMSYLPFPHMVIIMATQ